MKPLLVALCIALGASVSYGQGMPSGTYSPSRQNVWGDDLPDFELAVAMLAETLYDPSPTVRQAAVMALQEMGWAAVSALPAITDLVRDPDSFVRIDALHTLAKLAPDSVPYLASLLCDPNSRVRMLVAYTLRRIGPEAAEAVPALTARLYDPDVSVRQAAVLALQDIGAASKPVIPPIAELLHDPDRYVRADAAQTMVKLSPESMSSVVLQLRNGDPEVRQLAAQTLERIAAETKLPARPSGR